MRHWKPKPPTTYWQTVSRKDTRPMCETCGELPKSFRYAICTEVSCMRGDDEVRFYCVPCAIKMGITPDRMVCQALFAQLTPAERITVAERLR